MADTERRYSDREVALILRRAAELEDREGVELSARGLSLAELEQIARDVGLEIGRIRRAAVETEAGRHRLRDSISFGTAPSSTAVRGMEMPITGTVLRELVRSIDDLVDAPGTVTEALGTVRWTARDRFLTTQIAVGPGDGGTFIKVHERIEPRVRAAFHILPTVWGGAAGLAVVASAGLVGLPVAAVILSCAAVGTVAGRGAWEILSERSRNRVHRMVTDLADRARELSGRGASV
jgi:hypothetical protein